MDLPMKKITIYHKTEDGYVRYNKMASFRQTQSLNVDTTGKSETNTALIRIFDFDGYQDKWNCDLGDVIIDIDSNYDIENAPKTELVAKYGKEHTFIVNRVIKNIYEQELDHIRIEAN